jgi:hypothetical protein
MAGGFSTCHPLEEAIYQKSLASYRDSPSIFILVNTLLKSKILKEQYKWMVS